MGSPRKPAAPAGALEGFSRVREGDLTPGCALAPAGMPVARPIPELRFQREDVVLGPLPELPERGGQSEHVFRVRPARARRAAHLGDDLGEAGPGPGSSGSRAWPGRRDPGPGRPPSTSSGCHSRTYPPCSRWSRPASTASASSAATRKARPRQRAPGSGASVTTRPGARGVPRWSVDPCQKAAREAREPGRPGLLEREVGPPHERAVPEDPERPAHASS